MHKNHLINFFDEITKILSTTSDLNTTLTSVMRKIKTFTGAETWSLLITDDLFFKTIALKKSMNIKKFSARPAQLNYGRGGGDAKPQTVVKDRKVGRNDPCICGSGKKYKKCCGVNA